MTTIISNQHVLNEVNSNIIKLSTILIAFETYAFFSMEKENFASRTRGG